MDIQAETEGSMHLHDQAVEHFQALQPHFFTSFARLDLREHSSFDVGYDDYNPLFSCRTFEANLEETC